VVFLTNEVDGILEEEFEDIKGVIRIRN